MERLLTVEFGPSRSKRFAKALALAQGGPGECAESEPGRYRVTFLLASEDAIYSALGLLVHSCRPPTLLGHAGRRPRPKGLSSELSLAIGGDRTTHLRSPTPSCYRSSRAALLPPS
jgi:hypothetical protein